MTVRLDELLELLEPNYGRDFWSDQVLPLEVGPIMNRLGQDDWGALAGLCETRPAPWCVRLAQASQLCDNDGPFRALVAMVRRPDPEIGRAAAEALVQLGYEWNPEEKLTADLRRHLAQSPNGRGDGIRTLLMRLPS
jgi:hypothetical protein